MNLIRDYLAAHPYEPCVMWKDRVLDEVHISTVPTALEYGFAVDTTPLL